MTHHDDPRLAEAQGMAMRDIVARLDLSALKRSGQELVGPCPRCGGRDRFGVNLAKGQFLCRRCEGRGDGISLVQFVLGMDFKGALDWLCGPPEEIDPAERARRARLAEANRLQQEARAARERQRAIEGAADIWKAGVPAEGTLVRDYLAVRGITPDLLPVLPPCLRFAPALPYMAANGQGGWREVWRGPAMLAAVQGAGGRFSAVHRTWIDPVQDNGKAVIVLDGERAQAKKVLGSKKGGAVRLLTPEGADTLVMAEGLETTLSARIADPIPGAAYWAGVDLGNMAGRRERGPGLKFAGRPDLEDEDAFVPPPWVKRLVYVQDGDSDPRDTRSKLEAGLRRAMVRRPGLIGQIVPVGAGLDLNDVLRGATP